MASLKEVQIVFCGVLSLFGALILILKSGRVYSCCFRCLLQIKIANLCWDFFPNMCPIFFFFFQISIVFEFSLEYQYIPGCCVEHFHICFIYFGELPNMQHLYRENSIFSSLLISLSFLFVCLVFLLCSREEYWFWGCVFSEIEVL